MAKKSQSGHEIPLWGIFLLFLGVVFLLQTLGIIPWGLWSTLIRFWPVLIIIAGLYILLRHSHAWFATIVVLVLLFGCLGIAIWQYGPGLLSENIRSYSQPLASLRQAKIWISFAAGQLIVGSLPATSPNLVEARSLNRAGIQAVFSAADSQGNLDLSREKGSPEINAEANWDVRLTRNIPLSMDIKSSASQTNLNLADLNVTNLAVDANAGNFGLTMPAASGKGVIRANVANVEVSIPEGTAARIKSATKLGAIEVNERRFPRFGDYYTSSDFNTARNRLELELDCNVGHISVK